MENIENKEIVTSGKITRSLILHWLLYGVAWGILYTIVYGLIANKMSSPILIGLTAVVMQGVVAFLVWRSAIKVAFKKRTINHNDIGKVMKNLIIFTVIVCILSAAMNFGEVKNEIDKIVETEKQTMEWASSFRESIYGSEMYQEYVKETEEAIAKAKTNLYTYLIILEIGLTAVYLGVLPLAKKEMLKYVSEQETSVV